MTISKDHMHVVHSFSVVQVLIVNMLMGIVARQSHYKMGSLVHVSFVVVKLKRKKQKQKHTSGEKRLCCVVSNNTCKQFVSGSVLKICLFFNQLDRTPNGKGNMCIFPLIVQ